jgi:hypothetical protein
VPNSSPLNFQKPPQGKFVSIICTPQNLLNPLEKLDYEVELQENSSAGSSEQRAYHVSLDASNAS